MQVVVLRAIFVERILLAPIAAVRSHFGASAGEAYAPRPEIEIYATDNSERKSRVQETKFKVRP